METILDGHPFNMEPGMPQLDDYPISPTEPSFGCYWEQEICNYIVDNIKKDWNFLDVGAHYGQFGRIAAKRTNGTVYCFEPEPFNYSILESNCLKNMEPHNMILYEKNGEVGFHVRDIQGAGGHKVGGREMHPCRTLDSYGLRIEMMNIDVEGSGNSLLKGASETLKTTKYIIFEKHGDDSKAKTILLDRGFEIISNKNGFIAKK